MKQRTPVYVTISIILVILFIVYYMFVQNSSFLASPYFWGTVVISSILALIHHAIGDLIENDKFKKLKSAFRGIYDYKPLLKEIQHKSSMKNFI